MAEKKNYLTSNEQRALNFALSNRDYGWEPYVERKRFILTNPEEAQSVEYMAWVSAFRGTGHAEWEFLMAAWMVNAIREALETSGECNISRVFNTEFLASPRNEGDDYRRLKPEAVYNHIIKYFTIKKESENEVRLAANV